jgi:hypothetical protein
VPSGAGGDRRVRCVAATLFDLERNCIARVSMVVDDRVPVIVMFEGDPFLQVKQLDALTYRQQKPYRADALIEDFR